VIIGIHVKIMGMARNFMESADVDVHPKIARIDVNNILKMVLECFRGFDPFPHLKKHVELSFS
jgi:hypothetical protein